MSLELTIDGQSFDIPGAWEHNISSARLLGAVKTRGGNRAIPGATGTIAKPLIFDEVTVDLELEVYGENDSSGTPHADPLVGILDNLLYLQDFVQDGLGPTADATRPATLELPGGRTFAADVQIINWQLARYAVGVAYVAYDLRIPAGIWTETTPP